MRASTVTLVSCVLWSGCTKILSVNFDQAAYVLGSNPSGGPPGAPAGDAITTIGDVTVASDGGTGLGKHIVVDATAGQDAIARFFPTPGVFAQHYLLSARGHLGTSVSSIKMFGYDAAYEELPIVDVVFAFYEDGHPGAWLEPYDEEGATSYYVNGEPLTADAPHSVYLRVDTSSHRIFLTIVTELANGSILQDEMDVPYDVDFVQISKIEVSSWGYDDEAAAGEYYLGKIHLSSWSNAAQQNAVDTARRKGLLPPANPSDPRTTLAEELLLLETAFNASTATLQRWLPPETISIIRDIRH